MKSRGQAPERVEVRFDRIPASRLATWARAMRLKFRYDAAAVTDENRRHWANADNLSASAANSASIRRTLRMRARYEVANNSYAKGIIQTLANHAVGLGPRIQLLDVSADARKWMRREFAAWSREIALANKLRVMRKSKATNGETFAALTTNLNLEHQVKLDLVPIEADRISDPTLTGTDPTNIDGILLDVFGQPATYRVLRYHPGDNPNPDPAGFDEIPAARMVHWFTQDREGQYRGIPEITSSVPLFAELRRYTLAVIAAAETAADAAGVLTSEAPPDGATDEAEPFDTVEIERRMLMTLPSGYRLEQIKAEQPVTTYAEFKREIIKEIARCLDMPYNIAAGDSSDYNFASGRLDHGIYGTAIWVERDECERVILAKLMREWLREARLIPGYVPATLGRGVPEYQWHWDALQLGDPTKVATARDIGLRNGSTTLRQCYAEEGLDIEDELQTQAEDLGVTVEELKRALFNRLYTVPAPAITAEVEDQEVEEEPA